MATNIKCEHCGGNNVFNPSTGNLKCEYCGNTSECEQKEVVTGGLTKKYSSLYSPKSNNHCNNLYLCASCGATVGFEENEEKKRCPSCGDTSLKRQNSSMNIPDGIIPFSISRDKAVEIFRKWIKTRKFAPSDLKEMARLGKVSGLYVPAWNVGFRLVGNYFANVTKLEEEMDDRTVTWHYPVKDVIDKTYLNILISGNKRINDDVIDELSPFDTQKMRVYSNEYIYGFSGLNTDLSVHETYQEIVSDKKEKLTNRIRSDLKSKFDTIESLNVNFEVKNATLNYLYVPVWANHYSYNGKKYHCYINGQTGKVSGKSPKSFWKILSLILGISASIIAVVALISKLF